MEKPSCPQGTQAASQRTGPVSMPMPKVQPTCYNEPFLNNQPSFQRLSTANATPPKRSFNADLHAGIARRGGRSPSVARKLPEQKPRSPRGMSNVGKPQRGASGGMQGGPRRGRSPITGPALPHAAQAAKTTEKRKPPCPQDTEAISQRTSPFLFSSVYMSQIWIWLLYRSCSIA